MQKVRVKIFSDVSTATLEAEINNWLASWETGYNQIFIQSTNQSSVFDSTNANYEYITISIYYYLIKNK